MPVDPERVTRGFVDEILARVVEREEIVPFKEVKRLSAAGPQLRDARAALLAPGCTIIAELKRANPGQPLAAIRTPGALAEVFERAGTRMVGCLTEGAHYQGLLTDMYEVSQSVSVPIFCHDFIVDPYQIHEARVFGADMLTLQVGLLDQPRLEALIDRTESLGMAALAEVHTAEEADRAVEAGASIIGINARHLITRELDRNLFSEIVPNLPPEIIRVAMSGVRLPKDVLTYAGFGADAVVVGEALVAAENPGELARTLVSAGCHPACPSAR
ncbi:MAG: indole-3-glycerol phosphate synthase TrpC [Corynebacterium sp.]|nr:indole-3-glycerol phosphate synthase TrpC [Corynebacterium sp.]